jgi:hypothetical protein
MLRASFLILILLLVLLVGWIVAPMLIPPAMVRLDSSSELASMMLRPPAEAETVIAVATFGPAWHRYSPLLAPLIQSADAEALDRAAWLAGRSRVVAWTRGGYWGAVARPDPLRRMLARILAAARSAPIRVEGSEILFGTVGDPIPSAEVGELSEGLEGHVFILHRKKGGYPPIGRPALSAIEFDDGDLRVVTRAASSPEATAEMEGEFLPRSAPISLRFAKAPKAVLTLEQAFPVDLRAILEQGGMVALYGVETRGLLPRPQLVFSVPADDARAAAIIERIDRATTQGAIGLLLGMREQEARSVGETELFRREGVGLTIEFARRPGEFLLAFDKTSLTRFLEDESVPIAPGPAAWAMRARPRDLLPILDQVRSNTAIRLLAEDFATEAGDLAQAFRSIPRAEEVEARLEPAGDGMVIRAAVQLRD